MVDENIVPIYPQVDGSLSVFEKLHKPGSVEWSMKVFDYALRQFTQDQGSVSSLVKNIPREKLDELPVRLMGEMLILLILPLEEYKRKRPIKLMKKTNNEKCRFSLRVFGDLLTYSTTNNHIVDQMAGLVSATHTFIFHDSVVAICEKMINEK